MKKLILISLLFSSIVLYSQDEIIYNYKFDTPIISNNERGQTVSFSGSIQSANVGEPLLPYRAIKLMLPPGFEAVKIDIIPSNETLVSNNIDLQAKGYARQFSWHGNLNFYKNKEIYNSKNVYPKKQYGNISTYFMHGVGFALSTITPFKYVPATGKLSYYKNIKVKITIKKTEKALSSLNNLTLSQNNYYECLKFSDNKNIINKYTKRKSTPNDYEVLIIAPESYINLLHPLDSIYKNRGLKVKIASLQNILSTTNGVDDPEKMRNYIINQYQTYAIQYVNLAGDAELIPYRGLYCKVISSTIMEDQNIPSDVYFSALDGNWNNNSNNLWGEIGEEDLLPEIAVGRMPFSNENELLSIINKSIKHQDHPIVSEIRKPILAGEHLYDNPLSLGSQYLELLIGAHNDNGYNTIGIDSTQNFLKLYEELTPWNGTTLMNKIKEGRSFIHHSGHANESIVMKLVTNDIKNSNFEGVDGINHTFPIVYTHGCICGSFDNDDCIGERMVTINNFAAAFVGNSRYGWFNEGQTEGPSVHLHREFIDALFGDSIAQIGKAHSESKRATAPWVNAAGQWEEGALRWCFYDCNVLGDPAMSLWTNQPIEINTILPENLPIGSYSTEVKVFSNGAPVENLTVAIVNNDVLHARGKTDKDGCASLQFIAPITSETIAKVIVSGYNCVTTHYDLPIIAPNNAYVCYNSHSINDSLENNNKIVEYGENIKLNISLTNKGATVANNVNATLSTDDNFITIIKSSANFGNILPNDSSKVYNAFEFLVAKNVPNNHVVKFKLDVNGVEKTISFFYITVYSYSLDINNAIISNSSQIISPNEVFNFECDLKNIGNCNTPNIYAKLICNSNEITIIKDTIKLNVLKINEFKTLVFNNIAVSSIIENGSVAEFMLTILSENNEELYTKSFKFAMGLVSEDFETGTLTKLNWQTSPNNWIISNSHSHTGSYSAESANIGNSAKSSILIKLNVISKGNISFWHKTSSELNFDFLKFEVDNELKGKWSGENNWEIATFEVEKGEHTFKWTYVKDQYSAEGTDKVWIDDIVFPPVQIISVNDIEIVNNNNLLYPNPSTGFVYLKLEDNNIKADVTIFSVSGKVVYNNKITNNSIIDLSKFAKGIYFVKIIANNVIAKQKIVVF